MRRWRRVAECVVAGAVALAAQGCADEGGSGGADAGGGDAVADSTAADAAGTPDGATTPDGGADTGGAPDAAPDVAADAAQDTAGTPDGGPQDTAGAPDAAPDGGGIPDAAPADTADDGGGLPDATPADTADGGAVPLDPATVPLRGSCPQEVYLGGFLVEVQELFSVVDGKVLGGVDPNQVKEVVSDDGTCRLLRTDYPACDPLCGPGQTCAKGGVCVEFPTQQDLGTVTIVGLEKAVVMTPKPPGFNYFDTELPQPAFLPGVAIGLTSTPGFAGELALYGVGSSPIQLVQTAWVVADGQPLEFDWDPPPEGARTQVELRVTLDQHGNTPVALACELPDTGHATISAALVSELLSYGVSGFPNARVSRRTVDSVHIEAGCIDLVVGGPTSPSVTVSGHYPCSKPGDCPEGLVCNVPIETCE